MLNSATQSTTTPLRFIRVSGVYVCNVSVLRAQKLRVAYTAFAGTFTILWLGKEAGLYQKYGADMDLLYIGSSTRAVQALLGGDVDIVYSAAGAVVDANLAGADLTMVGCQYDTGQTSFFTTPPITGIAALKGKAVGVSRFGAFSDFVARHVLIKNRLQPIKDVALLQLGGTQEIIAAMQKNLVQGGSISLPLTLQARKLGFRELLTTETIALPFDYGCFIVKSSQVRTKRETLKKVLRATIAAYDLAILEPALAKKAIGKYTRTTDNETLDATYKENVKDYALRVPYVSVAGLSSIIDFRAEATAEARSSRSKKCSTTPCCRDTKRNDHAKVKVSHHETRTFRPHAKARQARAAPTSSCTKIISKSWNAPIRRAWIFILSPSITSTWDFRNVPARQLSRRGIAANQTNSFGSAGLRIAIVESDPRRRRSRAA